MAAEGWPTWRETDGTRRPCPRQASRDHIGFDAEVTMVARGRQWTGYSRLSVWCAAIARMEWQRCAGSRGGVGITIATQSAHGHEEKQMSIACVAGESGRSLGGIEILGLPRYIFGRGDFAIRWPNGVFRLTWKLELRVSR